MNDLISRKTAIEKIESHTRVGDELYPLTDTDKILNHAFEIAASCVYNLPSAQSETAERTAETAQNVSDEDLISRKAAIDAFDGVKVDEENCTEYDIGYNDGIDFAVSRLSVLPAVQPERKKGEWIDHTEDGYVECPFCHNATNCDGNKDELHFCFSCGADMREVNDGRSD